MFSDYVMSEYDSKSWWYKSYEVYDGNIGDVISDNRYQYFGHKDREPAERYMTADDFFAINPFPVPKPNAYNEYRHMSKLKDSTITAIYEDLPDGDERKELWFAELFYRRQERMSRMYYVFGEVPSSTIEFRRKMCEWVNAYGYNKSSIGSLLNHRYRQIIDVPSGIVTIGGSL